ncbi:hypothetical protein JCM10049v2_003916 [Rhodotorula toruloides]
MLLRPAIHARLAARAAKPSTLFPTHASSSRLAHAAATVQRLNVPPGAVVTVTRSADGKTISISVVNRGKEEENAGKKEDSFPSGRADHPAHLEQSSPATTRMVTQDDAGQVIVDARRKKRASKLEVADIVEAKPASPPPTAANAAPLEEPAAVFEAEWLDLKSSVVKPSVVKSSVVKSSERTDLGTLEIEATALTPAPVFDRPVPKRKRSRSRSVGLDRSKSGREQPPPASDIQLHRLLRQATLHSIDFARADSWLSTISGDERINIRESSLADSPATRPACDKLIIEIDGVELRAIEDARGVTVRQVVDAVAAHWDSTVSGVEKASLAKYWPGPVSASKTYREQLEDSEVKWVQIEDLGDGAVRLVAQKV